jgi:SAM-dependent methyltransferase
LGTSEYYEDYWSPDTEYRVAIHTESLYALLERVVTPTSDCLDFGCGDGRTAGPWLLHHAGSYVGADVSSIAVGEAREQGLDAREIPESGELPFDAESFDVVLATEVFEHLFRPDEACREIHRVLRPRGCLVITVPNAAYWRRRLDLALFARWNPMGDELSVGQPWRDPHIRFFTLAALRRMLSATGYEVAHAGGTGGALIKEIPGVRHLARRRSSAAYRFCERRAPSLLGFRLQAIAHKPE